MKIYLVRHGQSKLNAVEVHQYPHTKLSAAGIKQAELVSMRFNGVVADLVISSRLPRAMQTAGIIGKFIGKRVVYTKLLDEIKRSSEIEGLGWKSKEVRAYWKEVNKHMYDPKWHYSDEENMFDLKKRAIKAIKYIKGKKKGSVIVVSHGILIRWLIAVLMLGEDADVMDLRKVSRFLVMENTGITECRQWQG